MANIADVIINDAGNHVYKNKKTISFKGGAAHVKAIMERLRGWRPASGARFTITYEPQMDISSAASLYLNRRNLGNKPIPKDITPPTRGEWLVNIGGEIVKGTGTPYTGKMQISVYEERPNVTFIDFFVLFADKAGSTDFEEFFQVVYDRTRDTPLNTADEANNDGQGKQITLTSEIRVEQTYPNINPVTKKPWSSISERRQKFKIYLPYLEFRNALTEHLRNLCSERNIRWSIRYPHRGAIVELLNSIPARVDGRIVLMNLSGVTGLILVDNEPFEQIKIGVYEPLIERLQQDGIWKVTPNKPTGDGMILRYFFKDRPKRLPEIVSALSRQRENSGWATPLQIPPYISEQDIEIRFTRFQESGQGHVMAQATGDGRTKLEVTPIDKNWADYLNQDGWAMLHAELLNLNMLELPTVSKIAEEVEKFLNDLGKQRYSYTRKQIGKCVIIDANRDGKFWGSMSIEAPNKCGPTQGETDWSDFVTNGIWKQLEEVFGAEWKTITSDEKQPGFLANEKQAEARHNKRGMGEKRVKRAQICKSLKDNNPSLSRVALARKVTEILGEEVTEEDVRNDYRAMGWQWIRADRIR